MFGVFRPFAAPSKCRPVRPASPAPPSLRHWYLPLSRNQNPPVNNSAPVPAATTSAASEAATAAAGSASDDCCDVCLVAPRAGFALWSLCYARIRYDCGMPCLSCGHYHGNVRFLLDDCAGVRYSSYNIACCKKTSKWLQWADTRTFKQVSRCQVSRFQSPTLTPMHRRNTYAGPPTIWGRWLTIFSPSPQASIFPVHWGQI